MKKSLVIFLIIVVCISVCSCGDAISKNELVGVWSSTSMNYITSISFHDDYSFEYAFLDIDTSLGYVDIIGEQGGTGIFEIDQNGINLTFDEESPFNSSTMKFEDNKLFIDNYIFSKE